MVSRLKQLRHFFPTAVFTGSKLVFISEQWKVELSEHTRGQLSQDNQYSVIRVRLLARDAQGDYVPGHYEDFEIDDISDMASEIERYIQFAIGSNIRENPDVPE